MLEKASLATSIQAVEAVGEDFVDDGDGEEQGERDGEHEEDCDFSESEEEHGFCRAEGFASSTESTWPASPNVAEWKSRSAKVLSMTSRIAG